MTSRTSWRADIDVFSTVNVQHLESLNDQVAELTGVRVRETLPDEVLAAADEVVLIDLTPEALLGGCARGRSIPAARSRRRSPASSRSRTSRRCARSRCARSPRTSRRSAWSATRSTPAKSGSSARRHRRSPSACSPSSRCGRARSRSSDEPGVRHSASPATSTSSSSAIPRRFRRPRSASGSRACGGSPRSSARELLVEEGEDVADVAARVARERGTTYVLLGTPRSRGGLAPASATRS